MNEKECYFHKHDGCDCDGVWVEREEKQLPDSNEPEINTRIYRPATAGVTIDSPNGLRVSWTGIYGCIVERKDPDGNWNTIRGVQSINIKFDTEDKLPIFIIQEVALPKNIKKDSKNE